VTTLTRESSADGKVTLKSGKCTFEFTRRSPGVLEVRIEGTDKGQFGTAALDEIAMAIVRERPVELTVAIAQHLSRTGNLIQIYSDPSLFEARKGR